MARASASILDQLHTATAQALLKRINSGEATAADLNAASKFLKDNGIEALPTSGSALEELAKAVIPFPVSEDTPYTAH